MTVNGQLLIGMTYPMLQARILAAFPEAREKMNKMITDQKPHEQLKSAMNKMRTAGTKLGYSVIETDPEKRLKLYAEAQLSIGESVVYETFMRPQKR